MRTGERKPYVLQQPHHGFRGKDRKPGKEGQATREWLDVGDVIWLTPREHEQLKDRVREATPGEVKGTAKPKATKAAKAPAESGTDQDTGEGAGGEDDGTEAAGGADLPVLAEESYQDLRALATELGLEYEGNPKKKQLVEDLREKGVGV